MFFLGKFYQSGMIRSFDSEYLIFKKEYIKRIGYS